MRLAYLRLSLRVYPDDDVTMVRSVADDRHIASKSALPSFLRQRDRRGLTFCVSGRAMARLVRMSGAPNAGARPRVQDPELLRLTFDALISDSPETRKTELRRRLVGEIQRAMPLLAQPWPPFEDETMEHIRALQLSASICDTLVPTPMSPPMARSLDHKPIAKVRGDRLAKLTNRTLSSFARSSRGSWPVRSALPSIGASRSAVRAETAGSRPDHTAPSRPT